MGEEIDSLADVLIVFRDNCAMLGSEAIFRVIEAEGDQLQDKLSGKGYQSFLPKLRHAWCSTTVQQAAARRLQEVIP